MPSSQPFTVDFHCHVFPDALAPKAMARMTGELAGLYTPTSDGTVAGLLANMKKWRIDFAVSLPVLTRPEQARSVNEFAAEMNAKTPQIAFFGGLHPATDNWKRDIDFIASLGLKGIKMHPEVQGFSPGLPEYFPMFDYALSRGLILVFHAGADPAKKPPYHSRPRDFAVIADAMKGGVIVAAHLGGNMQWDEVEEHLAGKDIYLDTSAGFAFYGKKRFLSIAKRHGAGKLLFASDSPWTDAGEEMRALLSLSDASTSAQENLTEREVRLIAGLNAARLLGLKVRESAKA